MFPNKVLIFPKYSYALKTGTTNLINHLKELHPIEFEVKIGRKNKRVDKIGEMLGKRVDAQENSKSTHTQKINIATKLVVLAAESCIYALTGDGFKRFLMSFGVDVTHYPKDRHILENALDDVYSVALEVVQNTINKECPKVVSLSTDAWTDSHLGKSYINYNLIYDYNGKRRTILLETSPFDGPKTGSNLHQDLKRVLKKFGLLNKIIVPVSDGAFANDTCFRECEKDPEMNVPFRVSCINHKIHNLIYTDVLNSKHYANIELNSIIKKLKKIHKKVYYRKASIEKKIIERLTKDVWDKILSFVHDEQQEDFDELVDFIQNPEIPEKQAMLKKNNVTRWNSTLKMIRSFIPLNEIIYDILCQEKLTDLMISEKELTTLKELEIVFGIFEEVTNTFQVNFNLQLIFFFNFFRIS